MANFSNGTTAADSGTGVPPAVAASATGNRVRGPRDETRSSLVRGAIANILGTHIKPPLGLGLPPCRVTAYPGGSCESSIGAEHEVTVHAAREVGHSDGATHVSPRA